jgi:propanediol utilization protein
MSYPFNNSINGRTQVGISRTEEFKLGLDAPILCREDMKKDS